MDLNLIKSGAIKLMEARNDDHKDMLLMSRRLFHDNFQPHKSSNGKLLYRYGTREELRDALEQHTFDRLKPAVEFLAQATGKPSEKANSQPLPFCGIPLLDNVVSIALTGKYNLRYCIINRRYLEEEIPAMKHAPKISVHTWASCSVTVCRFLGIKSACLLLGRPRNAHGLSLASRSTSHISLGDTRATLNSLSIC